MKVVTIAFEVENWSAEEIENLIQERIDNAASLELTAGPQRHVFARPISMDVEER